MTSATLPVQSAARSRVIAGLLTVLAPGVGHLYADAPRRGLVVFIAFLALGAILLACLLFLPPTFRSYATFGAIAILLPVAAYLLAVVDAVRVAGRAGVAPRARWYILLAAVVGVWGSNYMITSLVPVMKPHLPWRNFTVASTSMQPTLRINEWLLADTRYFHTHAPARGDVIFYLLPSDNETIYIKRIVGLEGDRVAFRDGHAIVNGTMQAEPFADFGDPKAFFNTTAEVTVPAGHMFVAGDNRANSSDSRVKQHGMVPLQNLVGRATEVLLSDDWERPGTWVGSPAK